MSQNAGPFSLVRTGSGFICQRNRALTDSGDCAGVGRSCCGAPIFGVGGNCCVRRVPRGCRSRRRSSRSDGNPRAMDLQRRECGIHAQQTLAHLDPLAGRRAQWARKRSACRDRDRLDDVVSGWWGVGGRALLPASTDMSTWGSWGTLNHAKDGGVRSKLGQLGMDATGSRGSA